MTVVPREATGQADSGLLTIQGVSKHFGGVTAVDNCSLSIEAGTITAIIGPNGAGKSTLMNLIGGLYRPDSGRILFDGEDVTALPPYRRAKRGLMRTFQISRELAQLTVFENVLLAGQPVEIESPFAAFLMPRTVRREERRLARRAEELLERVGLFRLADMPAAGLSGGQKKLLELVRALMLEPKLILLDEPAAGVSPPMVRELARTIRELRDEGLTIGLVEHDMELVAELADRVDVLAEGRNLTGGSFQEVTRDARVVEAYLGGVA
ncbi:ABC transporter ATP-binding protein [Algihabitans albus]|uniref:ABC transporter ATP-binding protein n=1 Tax=Algihabitans albus TaxID=2164067 RepID=UPI000E5CC7A6|nr:ABC transporter ATP-binding protein [Algihabitans albus]